jgi:hypothetical protein
MVSVGRERAGTHNSNTHLMLTTFILFLPPLGKKENSRGKRLVWISFYEYAANDSTRYARFRKRQEEDATENERAHSVGATEVCSRGGRICDAEVPGLVCFVSFTAILFEPA